MRLILIRHGNADVAPNDDARPLNMVGRNEAKTLGTWLGKLDFNSPILWHSNKLRTLETANIIIENAGWSSAPIETQGLRPSSSVEEMAIHIEAESSDLVIVSHMPFMSSMASQLVTGNSFDSHWNFDTCGALILQRSGQSRWIVMAFTTPGLI
jgi:phosphohistidine phosphatase